jgi:DNA-directed RNA polymerase specialized sigma24 family protein
LDIQDIFELVQSGNQNAFGEVHRQLRHHMNPDPNVGVFTQLYNKYAVKDGDRDELNQDALLFVWESIVDGKLSRMKGWSELKSYASTFCYYKCLEYCKKRGKSVLQSNAAIKLHAQVKQRNVTDIETGFEGITQEMLALFSPKCRRIWDLALLGKKNDDIYDAIRGEFKLKNAEALKKYKSKCRSTMIKKAKVHPRFNDWNEHFNDFFDA